MKNGFYLTDGAHFKLVIENKKRKNFKYGGFSGRGIRWNCEKAGDGSIMMR